MTAEAVPTLQANRVTCWRLVQTKTYSRWLIWLEISQKQTLSSNIPQLSSKLLSASSSSPPSTTIRASQVKRFIPLLRLDLLFLLRNRVRVRVRRVDTVEVAPGIRIRFGISSSFSRCSSTLVRVRKRVRVRVEDTNFTGWFDNTES